MRNKFYSPDIKPESWELVLIEPKNEWGYLVGFYDEKDGDWDVYSPTEEPGNMIIYPEEEIKRWMYLDI